MRCRITKQEVIHDESAISNVYCGKNFVLFLTDSCIKAVSQHDKRLEATLKTTSKALYILKSDQPRVFVIVCEQELLIVRIEKKCKGIEPICTIQYEGDRRPTCAFSAQTWFVVAFDNMLHYYFFKNDNQFG